MNTQLLVRIVVTLIILGFIAWAVLAFLPLPYPWPQLIDFALIVCGLLYLLKALGGPTV